MWAMVCRPKVMPVGLKPTPRAVQPEVGRQVKKAEPEEPQQMEEGEHSQHAGGCQARGGYSSPAGCVLPCVPYKAPCAGLSQQCPPGDATAYEVGSAA